MSYNCFSGNHIFLGHWQSANEHNALRRNTPPSLFSEAGRSEKEKPWKSVIIVIILNVISISTCVVLDIDPEQERSYYGTEDGGNTSDVDLSSSSDADGVLQDGIEAR